MRTTTKTLLVMIALTLTGQAHALQLTSTAREMSGGHSAPEAIEMLPTQNGGMTLNQAVQQVRNQYKGRIVSAETRVNGNREVHVIKVLTDDGKVKTVRIPGRTRN